MLGWARIFNVRMKLEIGGKTLFTKKCKDTYAYQSNSQKHISFLNKRLNLQNDLIRVIIAEIRLFLRSDGIIEV